MPRFIFAKVKINMGREGSDLYVWIGLATIDPSSEHVKHRSSIA
jgi:hypothetical protein